MFCISSKLVKSHHPAEPLCKISFFFLFGVPLLRCDDGESLCTVACNCMCKCSVPTKLQQLTFVFFVTLKKKGKGTRGTDDHLSCQNKTQSGRTDSPITLPSLHGTVYKLFLSCTAEGFFFFFLKARSLLTLG